MDNKKLRILPISLLITLAWSTPAWAAQVGLLPIPVLRDVQVQAEVRLDPGPQWYTYSYTITNPATNTGEIWTINLDISQPSPEQIFSSQGLTIPFGVRTRPFDEVRRIGMRDPAPMVPVGMRVPSGWDGGLGPTGVADFTSGDPLTKGTDRIVPGETQGGFELISPGGPTLRRMELVPDWVLLVETEEDATPDLKRKAREVEDALPVRTTTLGPSGVLPGSYAHWNQLRDDLTQTIRLGWFPDAALAATLEAQLAAAREALEAQDGTQAKARLQTLLTTLAQSTPAQRRPEAAQLLRLNAERLM